MFQKIQKTLFWGHAAVLTFFAQIWQKWIFLEKRLCQVLNIPIIYHCAKN